MRNQDYGAGYSTGWGRAGLDSQKPGFDPEDYYDYVSFLESRAQGKDGFDRGFAAGRADKALALTLRALD